MSGSYRRLVLFCLVLLAGHLPARAGNLEFDVPADSQSLKLAPVHVPAWDLGLDIGWAEVRSDFLSNSSGSLVWGIDARRRVGGRTHVGLGFQRRAFDRLFWGNLDEPSIYREYHLDTYKLMLGWSFASGWIEGSRHVVQVGPALSRLHLPWGGTQDNGCLALDLSWVAPLVSHVELEVAASALMIIVDDGFGKTWGTEGGAHLGIRLH